MDNQEKPKRSLRDLVDEASSEKADKDFWTLSIVVGFEKTTKFIYAHNDPNSMLSELTEMVKAGGEPLGLLGMLRSEDRLSLTVYRRVFPEYADEEWIERYFDSLLTSFRKTATAQGFRVLPATNPETN